METSKIYVKEYQIKLFHKMYVSFAHNLFIF